MNAVLNSIALVPADVSLLAWLNQADPGDTIEYHRGFLVLDRSVRSAVLSEAGHEARPVEGAKSQYDVIADGSVVFSKQERGRFPEDDEILDLLATRSA